MQTRRHPVFVWRITLIAAIATIAISVQRGTLAAGESRYSLPAAISSASVVGRLSADATINFEFTLPLRNRSELSTKLRRVYDRTDPEYGKYMTPREFADNFGPVQQDYDTAAQQAEAMGFAVTGRHSNRL